MEEIAHIDSVVFAVDVSHGSNRPVNGRMETVIILWCKAEDC